MSKKLLILSILTFVVAGGVWLYINNRVVSQPTQTSNTITTNPQEKTQLNQQEESFSPQHIMAIPGSNQVWYEIPEMGIKLLLPKEGAEELVYRYYTVDNSIISFNPETKDEEWVENILTVEFSSKQVLDYNQHCDSPACGTDVFNFFIEKIPGIYNNHPLAFGSKFIRQFKDFYLITGGSQQAVPFANNEEEKKFYQTVHFPPVPPLTKMHIELLEVK